MDAVTKTGIVKLGGMWHVQPPEGAGYYVDTATGQLGVEDEDAGEIRWHVVTEGGLVLVRVEPYPKELDAAWNASVYGDMEDVEPYDGPDEPPAPDAFQ
jgi:hypothetical protein